MRRKLFQMEHNFLTSNLILCYRLIKEWVIVIITFWPKTCKKIVFQMTIEVQIKFLEILKMNINLLKILIFILITLIILPYNNNFNSNTLKCKCLWIIIIQKIPVPFYKTKISKCNSRSIMKNKFINF